MGSTECARLGVARGIASKVKQDHGREIHTEGEVRAGNKGYRCAKASVKDSSNQPKLTESLIAP